MSRWRRRGISPFRDVFAALAVLFSGGLACTEKSDPRPRLIILVSVDTLRPDRLGAYGYPLPTSPRIDAFAEQGIVFEDTSATSPWTLPSHGSLLTGLYPSRHGLNSHEHYLPSELDTLASILSRAGFETAAVVNSINLSSRFGLDRGFQKFRYIEERVDRVEPTTAILDQAIDWLEQRTEKPLFLFIHSYDAHSDYHSMPAYEKQFVSAYEGIADGSTAQLMAFRDGKLDLGEADARHLSERYDAGIRQMDDELGRLFRYLDGETGRDGRSLWESTLFVLTSDHGEEFLEHGGVLHGRTQFQEVLHVPLIMRGPNVPPGTRISAPSSLIDIMPTILASVGGRLPEQATGVSLQSYFGENQEAGKAERFLFGEADHNNAEHDMTRMVRFQQFKLRHDRVLGTSVLHDLSQDPTERIDVSSERPRIFDRLRTRLLTFMSGATETTPTIELTPEELERLRTLGYVR